MKTVSSGTLIGLCENKTGSIGKGVKIYRNCGFELGCFCKIKYLNPVWGFCLVLLPEYLFNILFIIVSCLYDIITEQRLNQVTRGVRNCTDGGVSGAGWLRLTAVSVQGFSLRTSCHHSAECYFYVCSLLVPFLTANFVFSFFPALRLVEEKFGGLDERPSVPY